MQEISVDQYKFYSLNLSLTFLDFLFSIYTVAILFLLLVIFISLSCFIKTFLSLRVSKPSTVAAQNSTMVALSSTMTSSSSTSTMSSSSAMNLVNLSNMLNMMTVKLDNTNYIVWKHQISVVLETYSLFELLEEPQLIPEKFLKNLSTSYTTIGNPDFLVWKSKEKALLTFISSTLSPSILALIVECATTIEVWKVLENRFSSISRCHIMKLKGELHNLKKESDFVDICLQKIKVVRE